ADVMEEYTWQQQDCLKTDKLCLSAEEAAVYAVLSCERPVPLDEIICKLRSDVSNIVFILLQMQLRGLVTEYAPRQYIRAVKEDAL
ncbi:MAG: DNA-processing protein DprA, partial [Selenomonadaceae bacterium]